MQNQMIGEERIELHTERMILVAATPDHLRAEIESPLKLGSLLDADVPADWPPGEYDPHAREFFLDRMVRSGAPAAGWYVWYAVRRASAGVRASLLGAGGFLGPPNAEGEVEIGYSMSRAWMGQGYTREMVRGLASRALSDPRVTRILAHTSEENSPSRSILEGTGFRVAGAGTAPGNIRYEMCRDSREGTSG